MSMTIARSKMHKKRIAGWMHGGYRYDAFQCIPVSSLGRPNAVILHFAKKGGGRLKFDTDVIDMSVCPGFLAEMQRSCSGPQLKEDSLQSLLGTAEVFDADVLTWLAPDSPQNLSKVLGDIIQPDLAEYYAEHFNPTHYSLLVGVFNNNDPAKMSMPIVVRYKLSQASGQDDRTYLLGMHNSNGKAPQSDVFQEDAFVMWGNNDQVGKPVVYSSAVVPAFLPKFVSGLAIEGEQENGDCVFANSDLAEGFMYGFERQMRGI